VTSSLSAINWLISPGLGSIRRPGRQVAAWSSQGSSFRISLTYDGQAGTGKTTAHTDTFHGRFVKLVTNEQVVEVVEFETTDPVLQVR